MMHAIIWGSESWESNKDEYDRRNALCLWNPACSFRTDLHFADVPNERIPMYGHSWPQHHSARLQQDTDWATRHGGTVIGGRYVTWRIRLAPGAEESATGVTLTALTELVDTEGAIPPGQKCYLLMNLSKITHQVMLFFAQKSKMNMLSWVHLLHKCWSSFFFCKIRFVICSSGWPCIWQIMWIISTCILKWAMRNAQTCCSNSRIQKISGCSSLYQKWVGKVKILLSQTMR